VSSRLSGTAVRTCVGCGERDAQGTLLRIQATPEGCLHAVDEAHGGRSAYVHPRVRCLGLVARSRLLNRSLRATIDGAARASLAATLQDAVRRDSDRDRV
jgi:predicted RNA-binding protein YlxR (DUF448 family)